MGCLFGSPLSTAAMDDIPHSSNDDRRDRYPNGQQFEVTCEEGLDLLAEQEDQQPNRAESGSTSNRRRYDELASIHVPNAGGDGKHLVGHRRERGDQYGPDPVPLEEAINVSHPAFAEHPRENGPAEPHPQRMADDGARHGGDGDEHSQRDRNRLLDEGHRQEKRVRRNGKEDGLGKRADKENGDSPVAIRKAQQPVGEVVEKLQHGGRRLCFLFDA